jgi:hypothetical protein
MQERVQDAIEEKAEDARAAAREQAEAAASQAEWTGPVTKTAFAWKSAKGTPDATFRAVLLERTWAEMQRLTEAEYDEGVSALRAAPPER